MPSQESQKVQTMDKEALSKKRTSPERTRELYCWYLQDFHTFCSYPQMPYLGTKRPSDGADMRAFRGARCLDRSPLSLQQKKENYCTLKILHNKSISQENKTPLTSPSQPEFATETQQLFCFQCPKCTWVTVTNPPLVLSKDNLKVHFLRCLTMSQKYQQNHRESINQCHTWANERETSEFWPGKQKASSPQSSEEPSVSQRDL